MRKNMLVLTTTAAILAYGAIAASAQAPDTQTPSGQQTAPIPQPPSFVPRSPSEAAPLPQPPSATAPFPQPPTADAPLPQPSSAAAPQPSSEGYPRGMMGKVQDHYGGRRGAMGPNVMGSMMIRMMFALMDADGDGKLSLQELQAAQERIFKAMDANKDGFVTLQEMQNFIRGTPQE